MVGGERKAALIAGARALLSPIRWEEPFGLSVIEALASGTPVITTPRGAMPEIVTEDVGFLCSADEDYGRAFAEIESISRARCREYVEERFSVARMAEGYLELYRRILDGETLP
jgi:glycosyltransferase involved in cell wall biosynthesis